MCIYIHTYIYMRSVWYVRIYRYIYVHSPQPFLLIALVGYRPAKQITHVTPVTFSQTDACVKVKKGSVMKGATCPALPGCRRASLPPPSQTGGCRRPQRRGSRTTFEKGSQHRAPTSPGVSFCRVPSPLGCAGRARPSLA